MYKYMYIYIHICIYICTYIYIHIYISYLHISHLMITNTHKTNEAKVSIMILGHGLTSLWTGVGSRRYLHRKLGISKESFHVIVIIIVCFNFFLLIQLSILNGNASLGATVCPIYREFHKWKVPQNGLFIMEHPIKMDDLGVPLFQETCI